MLVAFLPIFVADTKMIFIHSFVAPFKAAYFEWVLLNRAPTSTHLHSPPPSSFQPLPNSLQHPQQYLNQILHVIGQFPQI